MWEVQASTLLLWAWGSPVAGSLWAGRGRLAGAFGGNSGGSGSWLQSVGTSEAWPPRLLRRARYRSHRRAAARLQAGVQWLASPLRPTIVRRPHVQSSLHGCRIRTPMDCLMMYCCGSNSLTARAHTRTRLSARYVADAQPPRAGTAAPTLPAHALRCCGEQEIVLAPLDAVVTTTSRRGALSARVDKLLDSEHLPRTASDEKESNLAISELAAKTRWKQLLAGVKVGDAGVVQRLLRDVRGLADAPSPTSVRSLLGRTKAGAPEPYGSQRRPLHYASLYKQPDMARLLLAHGADPNATDKQGWSPLHCAALNGDVAVARLLLAAGAAPSARVFLHGGSDQGETPAVFARRHQQDSVAQVIERHVATTATVLAYQRLAWASAFHERLGANSPTPTTLGRPSTYVAKSRSPQDQCAGIALATSSTQQGLQAVSRSVALGCLVDFPPGSLALRVARMVPTGTSTDAPFGYPGPTRELMLRVWKETNPAWTPSHGGLQDLPWCD